MRREMPDRIEASGSINPDRRRLLLAVPAVLAGAWWVARTGVPGPVCARLIEAGPRRVLPLVLADLYGPHDLAG
jgi:hypothetical protein